MDQLKHTYLHEFPEHAIIIVELISQWNLLEDNITGAVVFFTGMHLDQCDLMLGQIQSRQRLDVVLALGRSVLRKRPERLAEFEKVVDFASQRLKFRNRIAHGIYGKNEDGELCIIRRKFETDHASHTTPLRMNDLLIDVDNVVKASQLAFDLLTNLGDDLPPGIGAASEQIWRSLGLPDLAKPEKTNPPTP